MALDRSLIGVVGACSALFVIFCVLAVIIGCFCLRRARARRLKKLIEEKTRQQREQECQPNLQYMHGTMNSAGSLPAYSNGGSVPRSDTMPPKMADYRPKILEDNMISKGYRVESRSPRDPVSSIRDNRPISTIDAENTSLNYNQTNGSVVKGYLRSIPGGQSVNEGSQSGSTRGHTVYGYPVGYHSAMGPVLHEMEQLRGHQDIKQNVEMGQDGRLVVARSERQFVDQASGSVVRSPPVEPAVSADHRTVHKEVGERSSPLKAAGQARVVSFGLSEGVEEPQQAVMETMCAAGSHRQRDGQGAEEAQSAWPSSLPEEPNRGETGKHDEADTVGGMPTVYNTRVAQDVPHDAMVYSVSESGAVHTNSNTDEVHETPGGEAVHTSNEKNSRQDNYKVIRREHSGHSRMPEWTGNPQTVNSVQPREKLRRVKAGVEGLVADGPERPGHSGTPSTLPDNSKAATAQLYRRYTDTNNNNSRPVAFIDDSRHFTPISPASHSNIPPTVLPRPQTIYRARDKSAVMFQETADAHVIRNEYGQVDFDGQDEGEKIRHATDSQRQSVGFRPVGSHNQQTTYTLPRASKRYENYMDDLPEAVIF